MRASGPFKYFAFEVVLVCFFSRGRQRDTVCEKGKCFSFPGLESKFGDTWVHAKVSCGGPQHSFSQTTLTESDFGKIYPEYRN